MSEVKRYDIGGYGDGMEVSADGAFVSFEDYDAAQSELAALREELASRNEVIAMKAREVVEAQTAVTGWAAKCKAAEQRSVELEALLHIHTEHVAQLCDVMFRFGLGMDKEPEQKIYSALAQQQVVFAALKPTESGASE